MVVSLTFASDSLAGSARVGFGEAVRSDESLPPSQAASRTANATAVAAMRERARPEVVVRVITRSGALAPPEPPARSGALAPPEPPALRMIPIIRSLCRIDPIQAAVDRD